MWRNGRELVPIFGADERLYYRFSPKHAALEKVYPPVVPLEFPDASVNRQSLSRPIDALIPAPGHALEFFTGYRVAWIPPAHLPIGLTEADGGAVEMIPTHDPDDYNYSHAEIRTHIAGAFDPEKEPTRPVRMIIRDHIARGAKVVPEEEVYDAADNGEAV